MCSIVEIILYHRYFSSKLSYPITGHSLLQYLCPSGHKWKIISRGVGWCVIMLLLKGEALNLELKCFQKNVWRHGEHTTETQTYQERGFGGGVASRWS